MCGIAGIWNKNSFINSKKFISDALTIQNHRGTDDAGIVGLDEQMLSAQHFITPLSSPLLNSDSFRSWENFQTSSFSLYFSHNRLSIIDTGTRGHQPMCDSSHSVWITYNGEIYNFKEIKKELQQLGYVFTTETDTEVIVNAYKHWGTDCFTKFSGMWAFVIYDQEKKCLIGSRDRTGVKPLFYYHSNNTFCFASELKVLISTEFIPKKLNPEVVFDYLVLGHSDDREQSFIENINELQPGCYFSLNLHSGQLTTYSWYAPPKHIQTKTYTTNELIEATEEKLIQSINNHLIADVPIGICISGGIDSSVIATIVHHITQKKLNHYTACFSSKNDETDWAKIISETTKSNWIKSFPNAQSLQKNLDDLIYTMDTPFYSFSVYSQYHLMKDISHSGIKLTMDGQGGDELFGGYTHHQDTYWANHPLQCFNSSEAFTNSWSAYKSSIKYKVKNTLFAHIPGYRYAHPEFRYIQNDLFRQYQPNIHAHFTNQNLPLNSYLNFQYYQRGLRMLLRVADRASMRFSIESRMPFADDHTLAEWVFSISEKYKIKNHISKFLLREAAKKYLPTPIYQRRDKVGFATPEYDWYKTLLPVFKDYLNQPKNEFIDYPKLLQDIDKLNDTALLNTSRIWRILNFTIWRKVFSI